MLSLKTGVNVTGLRPEILLAAIVAERVCESMNVECVITSALDGKHSATSLHYAGAAIDLRVRDFLAGDARKIVDLIQGKLGADFQVMLEKDHAHIEFQPRKL
jgi:hypothetical protein